MGSADAGLECLDGSCDPPRLPAAKDDKLDDSIVRKDWSLYSEVASTSVGGEKTMPR